MGIQTTYTPYIPRSKRTAATQQAQTLAQQAVTVANPHIRTAPLITTSAGGGVTKRTESLANGHGLVSSLGAREASAGLPGRDDGLSTALLDKVRALDSLPRLGALQTLDLRGNDLRVSVGMIISLCYILVSRCLLVSLGVCRLQVSLTT